MRVNKAIIHAYCTDGFFEMAKVFLESLYQTNGHWDFRMILSTRNFDYKKLKIIETQFPQVELENKPLDFVKMAEAAGLAESTLRKYKMQVEKSYVTPSNRVWKLMIAGDDRPKAIYDLLDRGLGQGIPILHFDIDTLFRRDMQPILSTAYDHDLCLLLREKINPVKARITISTVLLMNTHQTRRFFRNWLYQIDLIPAHLRPIGYGQISCWNAFQECREFLKVHKLGPAWGYPGLNKKINYVWAGAIHRLKKEDCVKQSRSELEALQS